MATWFQNLFGNEHSSSSSSSSKPFKQTHFNVVNLSASLVGVRVFNEDPDEVLCDSNTSCNDFGPEEEDSDFLNGFEPISIYKSLQVGHQYTYKSTSGCADSHVGTVVVESLGCTYYVFAQQMVTAFLEEGEDPSNLIISQKEDPMELSSSANDCKEEERIKVVILDEKDKIVVTLVVTNADETTRSLSDSEEEDNHNHDANWHMSHGTLDLTISELESDFFEAPTAARSKYRRSAKYLSRNPLRIPARPQKQKKSQQPQPRQKSPDHAKKRPLLSRRSNGNSSGRSLSSRSSSSSSLPQEKQQQQQQQQQGSFRRNRSRRAAIPNVLADDSSLESEDTAERRSSDSTTTTLTRNNSNESNNKATRRTAMAALSMDNDDSETIQETATRTDANETLYSGQLSW